MMLPKYSISFPDKSVLEEVMVITRDGHESPRKKVIYGS